MGLGIAQLDAVSMSVPCEDLTGKIILHEIFALERLPTFVLNIIAERGILGIVRDLQTRILSQIGDRLGT